MPCSPPRSVRSPVVGAVLQSSLSLSLSLSLSSINAHSLGHDHFQLPQPRRGVASSRQDHARTTRCRALSPTRTLCGHHIGNDATDPRAWLARAHTLNRPILTCARGSIRLSDAALHDTKCPLGHREQLALAVLDWLNSASSTTVMRSHEI